AWQSLENKRIEQESRRRSRERWRSHSTSACAFVALRSAFNLTRSIEGGLCQSGVPRNGWDHGRQKGFTNAPFAATSHTATRAHFHPFALARHSKVLLPNSRVSANSMTSRRVD